MPDTSYTLQSTPHYKRKRNVPYLNDIPSDSGTGNLNYTTVTDNIKDTTEKLKTYFNHRDNYNSDFNSDSTMIQLLDSNNELLKYDLDNKNKLINNIANRSRNILNNYHYNNTFKGTLINDISNGELDIIREKVYNMDKDVNEKKKQLDINIYYEKKFKHQIQIVKIVVILMLFLLFITYLYKSNIINEKVMVVSIAFGIFIIVMYVIYSIIDIIMRDNIKYDEYNSMFHSSIYLNKGDKTNLKNIDLPLHGQKDKPPNECTT